MFILKISLYQSRILTFKKIISATAMQGSERVLKFETSVLSTLNFNHKECPSTLHVYCLINILIKAYLPPE